MKMTTTQTNAVEVARAVSGITYDDGKKRDIYRVLETGLVQTGTEWWDGKRWTLSLKQVWDDSAEQWITVEPAVEDWSDWSKEQVVRASRSPSGKEDQRWFCRLPADVRQLIRANYGLVVAAHKCPDCGKPVIAQGALCDRCQHDQ
jgi:hypothetical protein